MIYRRMDLHQIPEQSIENRNIHAERLSDGLKPAGLKNETEKALDVERSNIRYQAGAVPSTGKIDRYLDVYYVGLLGSSSHRRCR